MAEYDLDLEEDVQERPFNKGHFLRIMGYASPHRKTVFAGAAFTLATIIVNLAEPLLFRKALDDGISQNNIRVLVTVLGTLLGLRLINYVCSRNQIRITNYLGQQILYELRKELFGHIESLPFSFFDHRPAGKIISRATNDVNHIGNLAASGVVNMLSQLISLVGIIAIMLTIHWKMALLSFTTLPLLVLVLTKVRWALESAWGDTRKAVGEINAHLNETVQGLQVIQAYGQEKNNSKKFFGANKKYQNAFIRALRIDLSFWPLSDFVGALGTAIVIWYGSMEYIKGTVTLGLILAFVNYLGKFWGPISTFSKVWSQILSAMASAERVFGILDLSKENSSEDQVLPKLKGEVAFQNVSFGYRKDEPVLSNVNFTIKPGETVALVGHTGAGKTTIINLLSRFYEPTGGKILVDGHDLAEVNLYSYRSQLGTVLQDTVIFSGTIMDNLKFGKPGASMEEIERAVEAVFVKDFIEKMPDKYNSEVKERGTNLSAGQRQLFAFARALLADPRILILDEATSSVDPETERLIQAALKKLLKGRTAFVIAHRLSTVRAADRIMVIDKGKLMEQGNHNELISTGGMYSKLYNAQFKASGPVVGLNPSSTNPTG